jgi:predicted transposase YdaD
MKTDSLFYRLFQSDPGLALELAGINVPEPERYRFGSHEIKQTAFRLDGVLEPPADQPRAIALCEKASVNQIDA